MENAEADRKDAVVFPKSRSLTRPLLFAGAFELFADDRYN